jgi:hypothetical protein
MTILFTNIGFYNNEKNSNMENISTLDSFQ